MLIILNIYNLHYYINVNIKFNIICIYVYIGYVSIFLMNRITKRETQQTEEY